MSSQLDDSEPNNEEKIIYNWARDQIFNVYENLITYGKKNTWNPTLMYGGALVVHEIWKELQTPLFFSVNEFGFTKCMEVTGTQKTFFGRGIEWNEGVFLIPQEANCSRTLIHELPARAETRFVPCQQKDELLKYYSQRYTH